jgi:hypothetical protein
MGYLPDRKSKTIFITGSTVVHDGKPSKIIIECKPEYVLLKLTGSTTLLPLAWEKIYEVAVRQQDINLELERRSKRLSPKGRDSPKS